MSVTRRLDEERGTGSSEFRGDWFGDPSSASVPRGREARSLSAPPEGGIQPKRARMAAVGAICVGAAALTATLAAPAGRQKAHVAPHRDSGLIRLAPSS